MEHICGHLKVQAADSANFRALVAEPRLGKVRHVLLSVYYLYIVALNFNQNMFLLHCPVVWWMSWM